MRWNLEYTDTFGGVANYSWVRRDEIDSPKGTSPRALSRRFKSALGLSGARGRTYWNGDIWEFRPYRSCTVAFASPEY